MTVSQAIGLCSSLRLIEPDPVHYDERFVTLLSALNEVSPVVESAELGLVYLGTDGLEGIFGAPEQIVAAIRLTVGQSDGRTVRLGYGLGKFVAWVAATRSNQTTRSSCHWVARKHFSLHSPFPFFRSTPTRTAVSANSASAPSAHSRRSLN